MPVSIPSVQGAVSPPGGRFESGDVVRFIGEPAEALMQFVSVTYEGNLLGRGTTVRSLHPLTAWVVGDSQFNLRAHTRTTRAASSLLLDGVLEFVYRPRPGEVVRHAYPTYPTTGAPEIAASWQQGQRLVDEEFVVGLCRYLETGSEAATAWNSWLGDTAMDYFGGCGNSGGALASWTHPPTLAEIRRGLGMWLLQSHGIVLCAICEAPNRHAELPCTHFTCAECDRHAADACSTCTDEVGESVCTSCCVCRECGVCQNGHRARRPCETCQGVGECCSCPDCEVDDCGSAARPCCDRCSDHCDCASYCIPLKERPMFHYKADRKDKAKLRRLIGAEIEVAGMRPGADKRPIRETLARWTASVVRDGSIGRGGVEIVTSPAAGANWTGMIFDIGAGLKTANAFTSERCGQHIHVDARDLKGQELAKLIQLYAQVEDALFAALPDTRRSSQYCIPCGPKYLGWLKDHKGRFSPHALAVKLYSIYSRVKPGTDPKERHKQEKALVAQHKKAKYDGVRYNALNLHSYWHRGTIEFRHAHGTNRPEQIRNWGIVCASIVEAAATFTHAQMDFAAMQGGRGALLYIIDQASGDAQAAEWLQSRWEKFAGFYSPDAQGEQ